MCTRTCPRSWQRKQWNKFCLGSKSRTAFQQHCKFRLKNIKALVNEFEDCCLPHDVGPTSALYNATVPDCNSKVGSFLLSRLCTKKLFLKIRASPRKTLRQNVALRSQLDFVKDTSIFEFNCLFQRKYSCLWCYKMWCHKDTRHWFRLLWVQWMFIANVFNLLRIDVIVSVMIYVS